MRSKIEKNQEKITSKKQAFFHIDFSSIFRRFWPRFGGSWGGFGHYLAVQEGSQKGTIKICIKIANFKGFREALGRVLGGFGEGFGGVLGGSGSFLGALRGPQGCFSCFV